MGKTKQVYMRTELEARILAVADDMGEDTSFSKAATSLIKEALAARAMKGTHNSRDLLAGLWNTRATKEAGK